MEEKEIWKDIEGYEGLYQVSSLGRVRRIYYNKGKVKILKPTTNKDDYLWVNLYKNGKKKNHYVHRLVAQAFLLNEGPKNEIEVNHINEDKTDNRVCNLNWIDHKTNCNWGGRNERISQNCINHPDKSKPIKQISLDGNVVTIWPSLNEARRNGFESGNICACCQGQRKTHKGFRWEYA